VRRAHVGTLACYRERGYGRGEATSAPFVVQLVSTCSTISNRASHPGHACSVRRSARPKSTVNVVIGTGRTSGGQADTRTLSQPGQCNAPRGVTAAGSCLMRHRSRIWPIFSVTSRSTAPPQVPHSYRSTCQMPPVSPFDEPPTGRLVIEPSQNAQRTITLEGNASACRTKPPSVQSASSPSSGSPSSSARMCPRGHSPFPLRAPRPAPRKGRALACSVRCAHVGSAAPE
jgi:hypothetical protein